MSHDVWFYAAAIAAVTSLGLSKGGFAGVGQIATPLLAMFLPPLQAAALLLPIMILQDAMSIWVYRREWDAWNLRVMLPGALVGVGAAWLLAAHVSDAVVRLGVGLISVAFVLHGWLASAPRVRHAPTTAAGTFWGAIAAFTSTMCQAGGPPFQIFVLPQRLKKLTYVGTVTIFFAAVNALKVVPFFALGQFTTENFATTLWLIPLAVATNLLGVWLVRITPTVVFYRIAHVLIFLISLQLIWAGATDLIGR